MSDNPAPQAPATKLMLHHAAERPDCSPHFDPFSVIIFGDKSQYRVAVLRPVSVTPEILATYSRTLQPHLRSGLLELKTPDGRAVDRTTLQPLRGPRQAMALVERPVDSVKNDKNEGKGHVFVEHVGGNAPGATELPASAIAAFGPPAAEEAEEEVHEIPRGNPTTAYNPARSSKGRGR